MFPPECTCDPPLNAFGRPCQIHGTMGKGAKSGYECLVCSRITPSTYYTTTPPTEPGDWHMKPPGMERTICRVYRDDLGFWAKDVEYDLPYLVCDLSPMTLWAGPIPAPTD